MGQQDDFSRNLETLREKCIEDLIRLSLSRESTYDERRELFKQKIIIILDKLHKLVDKKCNDSEVNIRVRFYEVLNGYSIWDNGSNEITDVKPTDKAILWPSLLFKVKDTISSNYSTNCLKDYNCLEPLRKIPGFVLCSNKDVLEGMYNGEFIICELRPGQDTYINELKNLQTELWNNVNSSSDTAIEIISAELCNQLSNIDQFCHYFFNGMPFEEKHIYITITIQINGNDVLSIYDIREMINIASLIGGIAILMARSTYDNRKIQKYEYYDHIKGNIVWNIILTELESMNPRCTVSWIAKNVKDAIVAIYKSLKNSTISPESEKELCYEIYTKFAEECISKILKTSSDKVCNLLYIALDYEDSLKSIPKYRQHFIHSFNVCILGIALISLIGVEKFYLSLDEELPSNNSDEAITIINSDIEHKVKERIVVSPEVMNRKVCEIWILISMLHDIAYPAAKAEEWVGKFFDKMMFEDPDNCKVPVSKEIAHMLSFDNYQNQLRRIYKYECNGYDETEVNTIENTILQSLLRECNHGVLSALMVRKAINDEENEILSESHKNIITDAILWHADLWAKDNVLEVIRNVNECVHSNIFRNLLIICDISQEWDRPHSNSDYNIWDIKLKTLSGDPKSNEIMIMLEYKEKDRENSDERTTISKNRMTAEDWLKKYWKDIETKLGKLQGWCNIEGRRIVLRYVFYDMSNVIIDVSRYGNDTKLYDDNAFLLSL